MWTTRPEPRSAIAPATIFVKRNGPTRFVCRTCSRSSHPVSRSRRSGVGPSVLALCTRSSMGPTSAAAAPAIRWAWSLSPTSPASACASPPSSRMRATVLCRSSSPRATRTTLAPAPESSSASAAPSPLLAPVMRTPFPRIVVTSAPLIAPRRFPIGAGDNGLAESYCAGMDRLPAHLASNVKQLRNARGATQQQMAKLAGIPRATWANLESGSANPTLSVLHRVAGVLQVTLEELLAAPRAASRFYPRGSLPVRNRGQVPLRQLLPDPIPGTEISRMELSPLARLTGIPHTPGTREYLTCDSGQIALYVA